jgi:DNA-binding response OmpR family regulator
MADIKKTPMLIVEDDHAWFETLKSRFGNQYDISHVTTGEEAAERILEVKPKYVILDYHLEGQMTGLDTLKVIKKKYPQAYVIAFSSQDDVQVAVDIFDNGAYDYVVKNQTTFFNRMKIIIRNIETSEALQEQVFALNVKVKRERFWLSMVIAAIFLISFIIYLRLCPQDRIIGWDPFNVGSKETCSQQLNANP